MQQPGVCFDIGYCHDLCIHYLKLSISSFPCLPSMWYVGWWLDRQGTSTFGVVIAHLSKFADCDRTIGIYAPYVYLNLAFITISISSQSVSPQIEPIRIWFLLEEHIHVNRWACRKYSVFYLSLAERNPYIFKKKRNLTSHNSVKNEFLLLYHFLLTLMKPLKPCLLDRYRHQRKQNKNNYKK